MSFIDIAIIVFLAYGAWKGFKSGFIISLFTFLALFVGLYAGIHFSDYAVSLIQEETQLQDNYVPATAFTITFLAVGAMVYFGGKAIEKVVKVAQLSLFNKLAGLLLGLLKFTFFAGALIMIIESMDDRADIMSNEAKEESLLYQPIRSLVSTSIPVFKSSSTFLKDKLEDEISITAEENNEEA